MTDYTTILSTEAFPFYSANELINNETVRNINTIKFRCPLLFTYNGSKDIDLLVSSLEHFNEYLSSSYIIRANTPQQKLIELSDVMYNTRIKKNNEITFPRDRIEAYSLLYSIVGVEEDYDLEKFLSDLIKVIKNIKGASKVNIYCYPEGLINKNKWKKHFNSDYNAKIIAYFTSNKVMEVEDNNSGNYNSNNSNNNNSVLINSAIEAGKGALTGGALGLGLCSSAWIIGKLLQIFSSTSDSLLLTFSSYWLIVGGVCSLAGGGCGFLYGLNNKEKLRERREIERYMSMNNTRNIQKDRYWEQKKN